MFREAPTEDEELRGFVISHRTPKRWLKRAAKFGPGLFFYHKEPGRHLNEGSQWNVRFPKPPFFADNHFISHFISLSNPAVIEVFAYSAGPVPHVALAIQPSAQTRGPGNLSSHTAVRHSGGVILKKALALSVLPLALLLFGAASGG